MIERFDLDLADTLARQFKISSDFFKRCYLDTTQPITPLENPPLLFRQLLDPFGNQITNLGRLQQRFRIKYIVVGDGIGNGVTGINFERRIQRSDMLVECHGTPDIFCRTINQMRDMLGVDLAAIRQLKMANRAKNQIDFLYHVNRQPDRT